MALTIAIPFYRGQHYLRQAIDSALHQKQPAARIVICDDAGPERGTRELVLSYGDARLGYARNERTLGMAGNWNRCLELVDTDLVTLLHADDRLLPGYVATMTAAAERAPGAAALFCRAAIIDADGQPCWSLGDFVKRFLEPAGDPLRLEGRTGLEALLWGDFIMCPTVCYRKSVLGARRFSAEWQQVLDLDFFTRLLLDGAHLVGVREQAYAYRRHAENATAQQTRALLRFQEESELYDRLARVALERGWLRAARRARAKRIIKLHLAYRVVRDAASLRGADAWRKLSFLWRLGLP